MKKNISQEGVRKTALAVSLAISLGSVTSALAENVNIVPENLLKKSNLETENLKTKLEQKNQNLNNNVEEEISHTINKEISVGGLRFKITNVNEKYVEFTGYDLQENNLSKAVLGDGSLITLNEGKISDLQLASIIYGDVEYKVTSIATNAINNDVLVLGATMIFPEVINVWKAAFKNASNLTSISLPKATQIWEEAFVGCSNLSEIYLPEVKNIYFSALAGTNLEMLDLPKVESIHSDVFTYTDSNKDLTTSSLKYLNIPNIKNLYAGALNGTRDLVINFGDYNEDVEYTFGAINSNNITLVAEDTKLKKILNKKYSNNENVNVVDKYSFEYFDFIFEVNSFENMTASLISTKDDKQINGLSEITIETVAAPNGLKFVINEISEGAFKDNQNTLNGKNINFPKVTKIGKSAFDGVNGLNKLTFASLTEVDENAFSNIETPLIIDFGASNFLINPNVFENSTGNISLISTHTGVIKILASVVESIDNVNLVTENINTAEDTSESTIILVEETTEATTDFVEEGSSEVTIIENVNGEELEVSIELPTEATTSFIEQDKYYKQYTNN